MEHLKISIIVPVYNLESELPRCLDSILSQTHPNLEIIVVDDGSLDNSRQVIETYAARDSRIKPVFKENGGVTSARLRGVQESHGQWIGFVDGDDEIEPDMYERLLSNALAYDAQISHCGYQMLFPDGRVTYFHNTGILAKHDKLTALRELLSGTTIEPGLCNKLFRRSLFSDLSMPMDIQINEDLLMNYYLFSASERSVFEDWCPYHYIVRSGSASRRKLNEHKIYDPIRVKEIIRQAAAEDIQNDAQQAYINTCINTYHTLLFAGSEYKDDLLKVHNLLAEETSRFSLMGKKRRLMAQLITACPVLYKPVYGIYRRFFQEDKYS